MKIHWKYVTGIAIDYHHTQPHSNVIQNSRSDPSNLLRGGLGEQVRHH